MVIEFDASRIGELLKKPEDETFDRTLGGQESLGKKIAGFGSKDGGLILVGQDDLDKGGQVVGVTEEFQRDFGNAIAEVRPTPLTRQTFLKVGNVTVAVIQVQEVGELKPCSYRGTYYERKGSSVRTLSHDEIKRYHLMYGSANNEDLPTHAKKSDIDSLELETYVALLKKEKENILESVTTKGFLSVRGVIILSTRPEDYLEGAFVEIQKYDNFFGSAPHPIGSPIRISKCARQLIQEVSGIIEQNVPLIRLYTGAKMTQSAAIPVSIIREAVTNAVAHRNYRSHEHIRIRIFSDGFDVSNPAVITETMWQEIQASQTTYHPNEGIYTFLSPAQLYEGRGEGIWKIREELAKLGKTAPEFKVIGEGPSTFYARISLTPARSKDVKRKKLEELILSKKEITTTEVMNKLKVSRVTAIDLMKTFVNQGILEHQGSTRSSRYISKLFNQNVH